MKSISREMVAWGLFGFAVVGGIIWISTLASNEKGSQSSGQNTTLSELLAVQSDDYVKGNPNAPVTLVEYLDFECEACGAYFPLVKQLEQEFPNDLRIVLRYFPLPGHANGLPAALAVEAAARQGKYKEMHDLLFTEQKNWGEKQKADPAIFEAYAQQLGLNMDQYRQDVVSESVRARVERDVESGKKLRNTGTPSFYLNGAKIQNPQSYEAFKALIEKAKSSSNVE